MSQEVVKPMIGTSVDALAETKRVYFRPSTSTDTVRVGDLVCYNWDLTTDYKERSSTPITNGTAYAEGSQNYTGRLFVVEKPATANLQFWAGVVARLGALAGADGDLIDIYIPNGAVVPVMCDQYCTAGRTVVAVRNGVYEGSYPSSTARPIGIAMETKDRSSTDGLVWVKVDPNMFAWGYHSSALNIDDEANASDVIVNKLHYTTPQTSGRFTAFEIKAEISSTGTSMSGGCGYGFALYTEVNVSGILSGSENCGVSFWTNLNAGADLTNKYFALEVGIYEGGADLSSCGFIAPLKLTQQIDSTNGPAAKKQYNMYLRAEGGGSNPDGLFVAYTAETIGMVGESAAAVSHVIPIQIENIDTTYYIMVSSAA